MAIGKQELIGFILMLLFVSFTASGIVLINVVFTVAPPYTIYGRQITFTVNVGLVLILLGLLALALLLRMGTK
ncbi:hypothetical protein DRO69_01430 [Candidatus Bathyarchaeota archaeon]|nr:MAG: hypothetical protein DRO69_01430 [Candidatus Bathyarchaeota archaeon]